MRQVDADLSSLDRAIINAFQGGFPVVERPFDPAAAALRDRGVDVSESALCDRIQELDDEGVLTRFGALVNAQEIGGNATLVAMHAPPERFDEITELVNSHLEVAHNYEREHPHLNMWFVVSVADEDRIEEVLAEIEAETGQETYDLPKIREFRVEAKFLVDGPVPEGDVDLSTLGPDVTPSDRTTLTPAERDLVLEIQGGLPISETPYADVAAALDAEAEWVVETIKRFDLEGKIRRVGVIPNHYALGYTENGMTVWNVPDDLVPEVGPEIASLDFVTHCYQRPRHEGVWPYNFFAMTHGRSEEESQRRIQEVREKMSEFWDVDEVPSSARRTQSEDVDEQDWDSLFSTRILKKTGIRLADRAEANTE
ncbi:DNA-binding transcriptional regulator, Lrp family [Halogranum amylolyticum]|uniref:siroheme decarboxylase n=1 Tax=Halogranum amylolyticum TaxID=660520 RepID=A0A1H8NJ50_9EURY|nr:Lrp/AsnC family transcriptional regulator [Halogranum amylolyticum]SEO29625.1 DNA-binding transcriptional regulator, Lrp family [Halogranum amylolyticum]